MFYNQKEDTRSFEQMSRDGDIRAMDDFIAHNYMTEHGDWMTPEYESASDFGI